MLALLFGASALIGVVANVVALQETGNHARERLIGNALVLLAAPLFLLIKRMIPWLVGVSMTLGALLLTVSIHLAGHGSEAVSAALMYLPLLVPAFYLYPRPVAWGHTVMIGVLAFAVLRDNPAFGAPEMVRGVGIALLLTTAVSWLVRASDLAERDYITGLTNRRGFERRAEAFLGAYDGSRPAALLVIDIDELKATNDRRGHKHGDDLLLRLGRSWSAALPPGTLLARHGGDEFTVLVDDVTPDQVDSLLDTMRSLSSGLSLTAGVAWCIAGETLTMLMLRADAAIFQAKSRGYGQTVTAPRGSTVHNGADIRRALEDQEFVLHYQPVVDLATGTVDKAEALVRWVRPDGQIVPPDQFIRLAEQTGTMLELGDWILSTAVHSATTWHHDGRPVAVSVNASGAELQDPTYARRVLRHVADAALAPERLIIELVESDFSLASRAVRANLVTLADAGVRLAIDDFGTGHSSLHRLDQLRVDILKIDRSFISPLTDPDQPMPVVTAILAMADALGLDVVAEGIETPEQADWLRRRGCSHGQGYLYGKPAPHPPATAVLHRSA
ncbi:putative bifunctional diguanylate cyclase/phosphodiesterase [Xylanimonas oleitrophica]|nr:EAL domain-containing protein [Xylanimonas oleitrophica]